MYGQCLLGFCYYGGRGGLVKDEEKAVELYKLAAEQGYAWAQCELGFCYYRGIGVAEDKKRAVELYSLAAEQGHARAQYNLGLCYENGEGVAEDLCLARQWYNRYRSRSQTGYFILVGLDILKLTTGTGQKYQKQLKREFGAERPSGHSCIVHCCTSSILMELSVVGSR